MNNFVKTLSFGVLIVFSSLLGVTKGQCDPTCTAVEQYCVNVTCTACTECVVAADCPYCPDEVQIAADELTIILNQLTSDCLTEVQQLMYCDEELAEALGDGYGCPDAADHAAYVVPNIDCNGGSAYTVDGESDPGHYDCISGKDVYETRCSDLEGRLCMISMTFSTAENATADCLTTGRIVDYYDCWPTVCTDEDEIVYAEFGKAMSELNSADLINLEEDDDCQVEGSASCPAASDDDVGDDTEEIEGDVPAGAGRLCVGLLVVFSSLMIFINM